MFNLSDHDESRSYVLFFIHTFLLRKNRKNKSFEKQIKRSIGEVIATRLLLIRRFRDPPLVEE